MTKKELIAALRASKAPSTETVYVWDTSRDARHEITKLDDSCGVLDINCGDKDYWEDE